MRFYFSLIFLFIFINLFSQSDTVIYYLNDGFETSPRNWQSLPDDEIIKWTYQNGGNDGNPVSAREGSYNAYLFWNGFESYERRLVSSPINLSASVKPQLTFYHTQAQSWDGTDNLVLLFKAGTNGTWDTIGEWYNPVSGWLQETFNIEEYGSKYLINPFYIAFSGTVRGGHGVCVDVVKIEEKDVIQRYIDTIYAFNIVQPLIPSGVKDVPVLKIGIEIIGNSGVLNIDSLKIRSLCTDNSVFEAGGFEIFYTRDEVFRTKDKGISTKIGSEQSMSGGIIKFNSLNKILKTGKHYFWLTADVKPSAAHNSLVDFILDANSIYVNGTGYPAASVSPPGNNIIEESVFFDGFETDKSWVLNPDFERDSPKGKYVLISKDPDYAYSGEKILGTDLNDDGAYKLSIDSTLAYFATTPLINLKYYDQIKLSLFKWIAFEQQDRSTIDVSIDGGTTWQSIWFNHVSGLSPENQWNNLFMYNPVNKLVKRQANVKFRFSIKYSDNNNAYAGWNIDNFAVTGNLLTNDIGITSIIAPYNDCSKPGFDTVKVVIRNYASVPTQPNLPVYYTLNGPQGTRIYDTITASINVDDSIIFSFTKTANILDPGTSHFFVSTNSPGDEDQANDSLSTFLYIQENLNPPSIVDFEEAGGYWIKGGINNNWECKITDGSIPVPPEGSKFWIQSPYGSYPTNDSSFIISSCYDLVTNDRLVLDVKYWMLSDAEDGANIHYSTDDGATWNVLKNTEFDYDWNWYSSSVAALNDLGWSGSTGNWINAKIVLPSSIKYEPKVKFRALWQSDGTGSNRGFAFDDFKVYPAPTDVGISYIDFPESSCLFQNPDQITVSVKNYGLNNIRANDTIPVGFRFEDQLVYDNVILATDLAPGDSIEFLFEDIIEITQPGSYQFSTFTLMEDDPWFYSQNNDTVTKTFEILPLPFTDLMDTIQSRRPDTVVIRAYYDENYSYNWEYGLSTADTLKVPRNGVYHVVVTDTGGNGCNISDSVYVELLFYDAGISKVLSPVNSCELSESENVQIEIKNFGTDSINAGSNINVWYEINGADPVTSTLTLQKPLYAYQTIPFTFSDAEDFSPIGVYDIKVYSYFGGDTIPLNDTLVTSFEVYGYPKVDLGPDTTVKALSHILDAGPGFVSYLWEDKDTLQTYLVDTSGYYHVMVLDEHNCPAYDTTYIRLKIRDVAPNKLISPVSSCEMTGLSTVQMQVKNSGNDTLFAGEKIQVKYKLNNDITRNDSIVLTSEMLPGSTVDYSFKTQEDLSDDGDYIFKIYATTEDDLLKSNDTLKDTVSIFPKPNVDFGYGAGPNYIEAEQVLLDAGENEFYEYFWQDESTTPKYTVINTGTYSVKVTDTRTQCFDGDTVFIVFRYKDIGITAVTMPSSVCSGPQKDIQVQIKNHGNTTLPTGSVIQVVSKVNGEVSGQENKTLSQQFTFGSTLTHTLTEPIQIPSTGPVIVKVYTVMANDKYASNDTFTLNYSTVKPSPVVNFGDVNGVLITTFPKTLDAGSGQQSYKWDNGLTTQTRIVTVTGNYSVTVTGTNGCITEKTVKVQDYVGLDEDKVKFDVKAYPNPAKDYFNLEMDATEQDDLIIEIYNSNGRLVHQSKAEGRRIITETFSIGDFPDGIYLLKIFNNEINYTGKILVQ